MSPNSAELQHVPTDGLRLRGVGSACLSGHHQQHRWAALEGNGKFTWTHESECHLGTALVQHSIAWGRWSKPLQASVSKCRTANPTFVYFNVLHKNLRHHRSKAALCNHGELLLTVRDLYR